MAYGLDSLAVDSGGKSKSQACVLRNIFSAFILSSAGLLLGCKHNPHRGGQPVGLEIVANRTGESQTLSLFIFIFD